MLSQCKNCGAQFNIAAGYSELFRYLALPCGRQLFTHCPYWWSSNGPDYSIGMRPSPTNMWASHNSPQASCFVTHPRCWCEDDTVCAAQENSIVVVPKVSYIFFHVPVQMFVLESAMLHFLTTICFALPVCLFGLQSDTWPFLPARSLYVKEIHTKTNSKYKEYVCLGWSLPCSTVRRLATKCDKTSRGGLGGLRRWASFISIIFIISIFSTIMFDFTTSMETLHWRASSTL